jgi:hypothetical protein
MPEYEYKVAKAPMKDSSRKHMRLDRYGPMTTGNGGR